MEVFWDVESVSNRGKGIIMMNVFTEDAEICTSASQTHNIDVV